jgi:hypothetical protein
LATNNSLEHLNLLCNRIGTKGAKALAVALTTNNTLKSLNLWVNHIGTEGAKGLAVVLATNNTLEQLDLHGNSIDDKGVNAFVKAMKENTDLAVLKINDSHETYKVIDFFLWLNRKGRSSVCSPIPILLSVWTEVRGTIDILYYPLRVRAGLLIATGNKCHKRSDGTACVSRHTILREK